MNKVGQIAREELMVTAKMRKELRLDQFIVMPNHLHAILFIDEIGSNQQELSIEVVEAHGRAPYIANQGPWVQLSPLIRLPVRAGSAKF